LDRFEVQFFRQTAQEHWVDKPKPISLATWSDELMRPIEAAGDSGQWPLRHQWRITSTAELRILGVQRHNAQSLVPCFLE
jgi:hypothetical protein